MHSMLSMALVLIRNAFSGRNLPAFELARANTVMREHMREQKNAQNGAVGRQWRHGRWLFLFCGCLLAGVRCFRLGYARLLALGNPFV